MCAFCWAPLSCWAISPLSLCCVVILFLLLALTAHSQLQLSCSLNNLMHKFTSGCWSTAFAFGRDEHSNRSLGYRQNQASCSQPDAVLYSRTPGGSRCFSSGSWNFGGKRRQPCIRWLLGMTAKRSVQPNITQNTFQLLALLVHKCFKEALKRSCLEEWWPLRPWCFVNIINHSLKITLQYCTTHIT